MSKVFRLPVLITSLAASLALGASAQAAPVTIGQLAPSNPKSLCTGGPADLIQSSVASGTAFTVPTAGVITSWSTSAGEETGGILTFKVYRPLSSPIFQVVGHDGPRGLTPSVLNVFAVDIPVQAGDVLGFGVQTAAEHHVACALPTENASDLFIGAEPSAVPDGSTLIAETSQPGVRLNLSATLLPPPTISGIVGGPGSGSIAGGSAVIINGTNFAQVKSVSFGSAPAASFTVSSEGMISAVAPPSATIGSVLVTVTTVAGTATSSQPFAYKGCLVPKLTGKKLKAAKKGLTKASCKLGKVKKLKGATAKTGKVKKQNPKPGKVLAPGAKVSVKLG